MQPFLRSPDLNLSGHLQVDDKHLHDSVDSVGLHNHRHIVDWSASVAGNRHDAWGGGGLVTAVLGVTRGHLGFADAAARTADAATADTQGPFTRWYASVSRLQTLTATTRINLSLSGQHSSRNLDSAEQFLLGGPDSVRGYTVSTLAGASGYLATVELRHDLTLAGPGQWQGTVFVDHGGLSLNARRWAAFAGSNHATLSSAGVGLNWSGPAQWAASVQVATPIGATSAVAGRRPATQAWVQLTKGF